MTITRSSLIEAADAPIHEQTDKTHTSAITIQTAYRKYAAYKKYGFQQIKMGITKFSGFWENTQSTIFTNGNDPEFTNLHQYKIGVPEKFAIIGTSCLRNLSIACDLRCGPIIPKIVIIDNEKDVYLFWRSLRELAKNSECKEEFLASISEHFNKDRHIFESGIKLSSIYDGNPIIYLSKLIDATNYDFIKTTILNTTIIRQSWSIPGLLLKIKNILALQNINTIYAYPSNILATLDTIKSRESLLINIQQLNPVLAIHTDLNGLIGQPVNVYYLTDHTPTYVSSLISFKPKRQESDPIDFSDPSQLSCPVM